MYLNTLVVVGDKFDSSMFNLGSFFGGNLDPDRMIAGPLAQLNFDAGRCSLTVDQKRIDLAVSADDVFPDELLGEAKSLASDLDSIRRAVVISGVGLNCSASMISTNGVELCNRLVDMNLLRAIASIPEPYSIGTTTAARYTVEDLIFDVRIEPHVQTNGQNLYVSVNVHQDVRPTDPITPTLDKYKFIREHIERIYDHVIEYLF